MNAATALMQARAAGVQVVLDGEDLVLEAAAPPPRGVLDLLERHKADLLLLLRRRANWTAEDWQVDIDERAAIAEFEGGLPRDQAEALAVSCCIAEELDQAEATALQAASRPEDARATRAKAGGGFLEARAHLPTTGGH